MAFSNANLTPVTVLGLTGTMWDYATGDNLSAIDNNYFSTADGAKAIRTGDVLRVTAADGKKMYIVTDASVVGVSVSISPRANVTSFI